MVFSSHIFILAFLPLTLLSFFLARYLLGHKGALVALTISSMIFYAYWDWRFLALLWCSILFNYYWSRLLLRPYPEVKRRWLLIIGVGANVGTLAFFKYTNFFLGNLAGLLGTDFNSLYIILPLGISFITFQKIAYLVDVWRERPEPYGLLEYALFVSFFPQLIAGPIVHHKELIPQIQDERLGTFRLESFNRGVAVFVIGLAKKVLIADNISSYADAVFAAAQRGESLSGLEAWGGTLAFALQLYFDFSGYADMAIGLALMLGIWLPENFDRPYIASSISDFWRRWHITLSRFLRDYLYIPLGGSRHGFAREMRNLLTTMVLGGIWHGAAWAFLLWGGMHGAYLVTQRLWRRFVHPLRLPTLPRPVVMTIAWLVTITAVMIAWVPFRAEELDATWRMWHAMFMGPTMPQAVRLVLGDTAGGWLEMLGVTFGGPFHLSLKLWAAALPLLAACLLLAMVLPNGHRLADLALRPLAGVELPRPRAVVARGVLAGLLFVGSLIYISYNSVFLYYQF